MPVPRSGNVAVGSTVAIVQPPVAEVRTNHSRGSNGSTGTATGHMYQPAMHSNNPSLVSMRRVRPRGVTFFSSVSTTASTTTTNNADMGGLYSFSVAGSGDRPGPPDSQNLGRHMDRLYAPSGREGPMQLPWIPLEGESQWWSPFNPTQNVQNLASFGQRQSGERIPQGRSDNGYPPHMGPSRMQPPYMWHVMLMKLGFETWCVGRFCHRVVHFVHCCVKLHGKRKKRQNCLTLITIAAAEGCLICGVDGKT